MDDIAGVAVYPQAHTAKGSLASMVNVRTYPRVLVIEPTPFNWHSCMGIMKSRLFSGWPKDRLAQIVYSSAQPSFDVCEHYWLISKTGILEGLLGRNLRPLIESLPPQAGTSTTPTELFHYDSRPRIERMFSGLDERFRVPIGEAILHLPWALSKPLRRWINAFNPDVVFSAAGTASILRMAVRVARSRKIPIVPYYTDDWPATQYENVLLRNRLRKNLSFWLRQCLALSTVRLACCDQMSAEYRNRYGGEFETLLFPEPSRDVSETIRQPGRTEPVQLVFIGSLTPDRWRSLREIGEALLDLHAEGLKGELVIYTLPAGVARFGPYLTLEPVMRTVGPALPEIVPLLQGQADVLVHVESFDAGFRRWTRLSLSTKIPQYLMAGKCIFAYGPAEAASMQYLSATKVGVTVGEQDPELLREALRQLISSAKLRQELAGRARAVGEQRHDDARQRERFRAAMVRGSTWAH